MPNRIIKESICESQGLSECSILASDLYKRLITYADDYGRFNSDTAIMRARLFPREYEEITEECIVDALVELAGVGKIYFYSTNYFNQGVNRRGVYGAFPNWEEHQRVRETKTKCPEPNDTGINDWYLRRFVPLDVKVAILERDGFKCKICGKYLTSCREAKRFIKLGTGLFHIDHIVPLLQGGRATMENLRLTCPECNMKRKKKFSFKEILDFTIAADRCNSPQVAALIQSNPNPNPNPNPISATPPAVSDDAVIRLPLNDGTEHGVKQADVEKWTGLYPAVDVMGELRKMVGWLDANPKNRKTKSGIGRFIAGWLSREQDRAKKVVGEQKESSFNTEDFFDKALKKSYQAMQQVSSK